MLWSFIAVCFSAWLYVDASYRGPVWQRWVFKPVTLLLLLLLAWQARCLMPSATLLAGLCASLIGDALTLLPRQQLLYAIGAFFLAHLLYTIYFATQMSLSSSGRCRGAAGCWRRADCGDLVASGRAAFTRLHIYRHDAGDGLAGR
jgi:uncharacterized membrane protein YhhN